MKGPGLNALGRKSKGKGPLRSITEWSFSCEYSRLLGPGYASEYGTSESGTSEYFESGFAEDAVHLGAADGADALCHTTA